MSGFVNQTHMLFTQTAANNSESELKQKR